ncbi:MAG: MarR family transcriptional regulator [Rhodopseudomonas sp.]|nr:MarR family transcriptional regulator [Rhodopseudomonas sp.]
MAPPPPVTPSADVAALAAELHTVAGRLKRRLREQASAGDLTPSQVAVLMHLDRAGPTTVTNLARAEGVRPQSMGATVAALEAAGLVKGAADPDDGRQTILSLTPACQKLFKDGRAARQDWLARAIVTKLTAPERKDLAKAIALLKRLVE